MNVNSADASKVSTPFWLIDVDCISFLRRVENYISDTAIVDSENSHTFENFEIYNSSMPRFPAAFRQVSNFFFFWGGKIESNKMSANQRQISFFFFARREWEKKQQAMGRKEGSKEMKVIRFGIGENFIFLRFLLFLSL